MAKVLIDIPDEIFNNIKDNMMTYVLTNSYHLIAGKAIAEGTPLPKGHARLISTADLDVSKLVDSDIEWVMGSCAISRVQEMIDNAPTIIEADKENDINGKSID